MRIFRKLLITLIAASPLPLGAQTVISNTILVPLHYKTISSGGQKLGIYATIGGGSTPQIFEFDTGGAGLYAAYATNNNSPWWAPASAPTETL